MSKFKGTGVAVITPFTDNMELDIDALKGIIEHLINNGIDYLVVLGTTAESATLSQAERKTVISTFVEEAAGRIPLVLGIGGNNTSEVVGHLNEPDLGPFSGILSVSPYYNKPSQEGIYQHYAAIARNTDKDVILYNVPGRTASNMEVETTLRLARDFDNIVAIKEASGDLVQAMNIAEKKPAGFDLISGDDSLTLPMQSIGAVGAISVIAHAYPLEFSGMVNAANRNDVEKARENHMLINAVTQAIYQEGNPVGIKALMQLKGHCRKNVRLPLTSASSHLEKQLALLA